MDLLLCPPLTPARAEVPIVDQRALAARITKLDVTDVQGGVLVTATGMPTRPGAFNVQLVTSARDGKTLTLQLRMQYPATNTAGQVSEVVVSTLLGNDDIAGVQVIRVQGETNSVERQY